MKHKILILTGCMIFSILIVFSMTYLSNQFRLEKNNFIRLFPPHFLDAPKSLDIKYNSYYIAGLTTNNIYLGNSTSFSHILVTDYNLKDLKILKLSDNNINNDVAWSAIQTQIDSPYIYMLEGISPAFFIGNLHSDSITQLKKFKNIYFDIFKLISSSSIIMRGYVPKFSQNILIKSGIDSTGLYSKNYKLEKQIDGIFCTDGTLHYNSQLSKLVYVYTFRNQFVCLDTNLNLILKGKTLDTNTVAKIKLSHIESQKRTTFSSPPLTVNRRSFTSGNLLYVNSNLLAKNENDESFKESSVIDIYSLVDGSYRYSFYIPDYNGKKISNFAVINNTVIAIYDHYILTYKINSYNLNNN